MGKMTMTMCRRGMAAILVTALGALMVLWAILPAMADGSAAVLGVVVIGNDAQAQGGATTWGLKRLSGVEVAIQNSKYTTHSDSAGMFFWPEVPAGQYTVTASKDGFGTVVKQITVEGGGAPVQLEFVLTQGGGVQVQQEGIVKAGTVAVAFASMYAPAPAMNPTGMMPGRIPGTMSELDVLGAINAGADPFALNGNAPLPRNPNNPFGNTAPISSNDNTLMLMDPEDPQNIKYLALTSKPYWVAFSASGNKLFAADDARRILVYDLLHGNALVAAVPLPAPATDLAVSPEGNSLYVLLAGSAPAVLILSSSTYQVVQTIPVPAMTGGGVPGQATALAISPDGRRLYVAVGTPQTGEVHAIDLLLKQYLGHCAVGPSPTGLAVTPDGRKLYVADYAGASVSVVDTGAMTLLTTLHVGVQPARVAMHPTGALAYVTNNGSGTVSVIDVLRDAVVGTLSVGPGPMGVSVSRDGSRLVVANNGNGTVSVIDPKSGVVIRTTPPQPRSRPFGVAIKP